MLQCLWVFVIKYVVVFVTTLDIKSFILVTSSLVVFTAHQFITVSFFRDVLFKWSRDISDMYDQCLKVGSDVCFIMHYEQLVLRPVENTKRLFKFLDIPWTPDVLHHEKHVNETHLST